MSQEAPPVRKNARGSITTQYSLTKINQLICFLIKEFVKERLYEHKRTVFSALELKHRQSMAKLCQQLIQFTFSKCLEKILKHLHLPYLHMYYNIFDTLLSPTEISLSSS